MQPNSILRHRTARLLAICGILLGSIIVAQAAITVTSLNDSGPGSLRQAIADAAPGDTIDFADLNSGIAVKRIIADGNNGRFDTKIVLSLNVKSRTL